VQGSDYWFLLIYNSYCPFLKRYSLGNGIILIKVFYDSACYIEEEEQ
jgi:hypothetical protein